MAGEVLDGRQVLIVIIDPHRFDSVSLLTGTAWLNGSAYEIKPDGGGPSIVLNADHVMRDGFSPSMLSRLVARDEDLALVDRLTKGVHLCVPIFDKTPPASALQTPGLLGGVAQGADGRIFLMQVR